MPAPGTPDIMRATETALPPEFPHPAFANDSYPQVYITLSVTMALVIRLLQSAQSEKHACNICTLAEKRAMQGNAMQCIHILQ